MSIKAYIIILFVLLIFTTCEKPNVSNNEIIITASNYKPGNKLPSPLQQYLLIIHYMDNPSSIYNDELHSYIYNDSVTNSKYKISDDDMNFGRYIITARKDSIEDIVEIIYKGGSVQLDLLLK